MLNLWFALPVAAMLAGLGLHVIALKALRAGHGKKQSGPAPEDKELPAPGHSLLQKIDRVATDLKAHRICIVVQPILLVGIVVLFRKYHSSLDLQFLVTSIVACGLGFLYCLWNLIHKRRELNRCRLDYGAEVQVGQVLDRLASQGYHIFHDFKEDGIDIDHVLVGPKGVFTVETKGYPRASKKGGTGDATVTYNGHALFFPRETDEGTVSYAVQQADLLSDWLGSATGEAISARAVVAIPGWFVKRTTSDGAPVVNLDQFASLFEHIAARPLSEGQITRIADLIQQKNQ